MPPGPPAARPAAAPHLLGARQALLQPRDSGGVARAGVRMRAAEVQRTRAHFEFTTRLRVHTSLPLARPDIGRARRPALVALMAIRPLAPGGGRSKRGRGERRANSCAARAVSVSENGDAVCCGADVVARKADAVTPEGDASDRSAAAYAPSASRDGRGSLQTSEMRLRWLPMRSQVVAMQASGGTETRQERKNLNAGERTAAAVATCALWATRIRTPAHTVRSHAYGIVPEKPGSRQR
jgi:hypothetical protein